MTTVPMTTVTSCAVCHGVGVLACLGGCHLTFCEDCSGTGATSPEGEPIGDQVDPGWAGWIVATRFGLSPDGPGPTTVAPATSTGNRL